MSNVSVLLLSSVIAFATATPTKANDRPEKGSFYLGVQSGWQQIDDHFHGYWKTEPPINFDLGRHSGNGLTGGIHAGYDHTVGKMRAGLEADFEGSAAEVDNTQNNWNWTARSRWQGSLRARVGVALGQAQIYATGGLTLANVEHRYVDLDPASVEDYRVTKAKVGYTIGGGAGYPLNDRVSARIEYRYSDYGTIVAEANPAWKEIEMHGVRTHAVRVGVSYRL